MNTGDFPKLSLALVAGSLALAACSSTPPATPASLTQAQSAYSTASANPDVARYGAVYLQDSQESLAIAQKSWKDYQSSGSQRDAAAVDQYSYLARRQAETADQVAKVRMAAAQATNVAREVTLGDVLFQVGKADLNPRGQKAVADLATFLKNHPDRSVVINGYTDSTGSAQLNARLSEARAKAVQTALINDGVNSDRIMAAGKGPANPVASNQTAAGRQQNRRVEVDISGGTAGMGTSATPPMGTSAAPAR